MVVELWMREAMAGRNGADKQVLANGHVGNED